MLRVLPDSGMRFLVLLGLAGILAGASANPPLFNPATSPAGWQEIRDHQPAALHLKLTLAKDHFFQGERIDAALEFSNDDAQKPFSVIVGVAAPGAIFHAADESGHAVANPFQWSDDWIPRAINGPVGIHALPYSLTLPIDQSPAGEGPGLASWRKGEVSFRTKYILDHQGWHFTEDQQRRLQAIIEAAPKPR